MPRRAPLTGHPAAPLTNEPAPLRVAPGEPVAHTRIRALMLAEHHGLIGQYVGPVDAADANPGEWSFMYMPRGRRVADLHPAQPRKGNRPAIPAEQPLVILGAEVLPLLYGIAVTQGLGEVFAYRDDLPGWDA